MREACPQVWGTGVLSGPAVARVGDLRWSGPRTLSSHPPTPRPLLCPYPQSVFAMAAWGFLLSFFHQPKAFVPQETRGQRSGWVFVSSPCGGCSPSRLVPRGCSPRTLLLHLHLPCAVPLPWPPAEVPSRRPVSGLGSPCLWAVNGIFSHCFSLGL